MNPPPLHGIHGRLRQHITKVGAAYANRISSAKRILDNDDYLRGLVHGGRVSEEQIQQAIDAYSHIPSNFVWLQNVEDSILDRADNVFAARHGRDPTQDADFRLNGEYYEICKRLKRDWHHYDSELEKLRWDYNDKGRSPVPAAPGIVERVKYETVRSGYTVAGWLGVALFYVLCSGYLFALGMGLMGPTMPPFIGFGCLGVLGLLAVLYKMWPRHIQTERKVRVCNQCGHEFFPWDSPTSCPSCGVKFHVR